MEDIPSMLPIVISGVCGLLLIALVSALIFNQSFRNDVLGGEGEATVLGILSVKGVAIVLLCGLFLAGLLYPLQFINSPNIREDYSNVSTPENISLSSSNIENIHLSAGSMTVIPSFNIGVKLSAGYNFQIKSREIRMSFAYPKNPLGKITENNKVDESVVSIQGMWIRPDIEQIISLGEVGKFSIIATEHAFNESHDSVTSIKLFIKRIKTP